jgi:hypothetical protein
MRHKHAAFLVVLSAAAVCLLALSTASASAAPSPWWQILTGSRPTNLWLPSDNVQEIATEIGAPAPGFEGFAGKVEVEGKVVACLGLNFVGELLCELETTFPDEQTAAQLEARLRTALGDDVTVSGGPVGGAPFRITVPGRLAPPITVAPVVGTAAATVISSGGSGRLVFTITNLGDAPAVGGSDPVMIDAQLPAGVEAAGYEAIGGAQGTAGPVECDVAATAVSCGFEGTLPPYEAIEIEIPVTLLGNPPVAGAPGTVTVSGGGAPVATASQNLRVSAEKTPFGVEFFSSRSEAEGGGSFRRAGGHPHQVTTTIQFNAGAMKTAPKRRESSVEQPAQPRNLRFALPSGLVGNASEMPVCPLSVFYGPFLNDCPDAAAIGVAAATAVEKKLLGFVRVAVPVFNLPPAHGEPARFGFMPAGVPVLINTAVDPDNGYRIVASVNNTTQLAQLLSSSVSLWGTPGDPSHDNARGWNCVWHLEDLGPCNRPENLTETAFLRQPVSCRDASVFSSEAEPWNVPLGSVVSRNSFADNSMVGCNQVPFNPRVGATSTSKRASSPSGLDFALDMPNSGLSKGDAIAEGQAKRVEVALPEGMTVNPSQGEGLVGCSPAAYAREQADSRPGEGCPEAAKIGDVQIRTPLLKEEARGSLYVASPHDNPFDSLISLYVVARIPERGILIKQAGKVEADPKTGRLVTTFDNLPQVPFSSFELHFRAGERAPLVTPSACGTYEIATKFTPWSAVDPDNPAPDEIVTRTSTLSIERGVDGGPCPGAGAPPFRPGLVAGSVSNAAGRYSPFNVRLTRNDGEQEFTNLSLKLPPGIVAKLAGTPFCSDAGIAAAKARNGPSGGQEELDGPSCPQTSQIGRTLVGAGVGSVLTHVPGKVYLAGPYRGGPLSIVAITAAKVGPFDLGTVVVRAALKVDPETAEVVVDGSSSDPIPHIIQGIVVHARDIRAYVDKPEFTLNPTSCERTSTVATVFGSGLDFASAADNRPVTASSPYQAADCANLGFKPRLSLSLKGGTKRGQNPALRAVMRSRPGDANSRSVSVRLPHSEFLDQSHIRTVCTRVQFNAGAGNGAQCPKAAIYGHAKAWTPILDEPLVGPVFLRSSKNPLPDLVLALHGLIDINAVGRIDSSDGGIRNSFDFVPDAPIGRVVLELQGGRKGLLENSVNLCREKHRATAKLGGHNGRTFEAKPILRAECPQSGKKGKRKQ